MQSLMLAIIIAISLVLLSNLGVQAAPLVFAQTTNSTNSTSQNFSMTQKAGNELSNQFKCNLYPTSEGCPP